MPLSVKRPPVDYNAVPDYPELSHGPQVPRRIILHSTEGPDAGFRAMKGILNYWSTQTPGYGTQLLIANDGGTIQAVPDRVKAWGCGGANTGSLQIEIDGHSYYTLKKWYSRPRQIMRVARWIAYWSKEYGIPIVHDTENGVSRHLDQSLKHPESDGHMDPGYKFPFFFTLKLARTLKRFGWR